MAASVASKGESVTPMSALHDNIVFSPDRLTVSGSIIDCIA